MMKARFLCLFLFLAIGFILAPRANAFSPYEYAITEFESVLSLEKDTSLIVKETIKVNFPDYRHGIFRVIPVVYTARGKTIRAGLEVMSITDEFGNPYRYEKSRLGQSAKLKIGDPDKTVTGLQTYIITYRISKVVQRFEDHDEIYWNITGSEWDTDILTAKAVVFSPFAAISNVDCFAGEFGTTQKLCQEEFGGQSAMFSSTAALGYGRDFTIVVALDKENELIFPGPIETAIAFILDNWGYPLALAPFTLMFYFWYKKGRDKKYAVGGVYYKPDDKTEVEKPIFAREHLPMVYHPIQGLTPSQIGTIIDERVDIHDVIAEIVEAARLKFLKIEKIEKPKFLGKSTDYSFTKLKDGIEGLNDYQVYILESLFDKEATSATIKEVEKLFKKDEDKLKQYLALAVDEKYVLLSALKAKFYIHLEEIKKRLYKSMEEQAIFDGNPDSVRVKWSGIFIGIDVAVAAFLFGFLSLTGNFVPLVVLGILSVPSFFLALKMPRKTAWGYSLYRQIEGLAYYLAKGKWRHEIAEKHLFFEEMIPLAISLEVVDKLAKDMQMLEVPPPSYFAGVTTSTISGDISKFESQASSTLMSTPGGKGASGWSGGSGFSGGFSGGGFGGGGGGSW